MSPLQANAVFEVLRAVAGASESMREDFTHHLSSDNPCDEYRFQGSLGFGGKYWRKTNTVSCYPEDWTPLREDFISRTNAILATLSCHPKPPVPCAMNKPTGIEALSPIMKYPTITIDGKTYDIYEVAAAFGITSHPLFNAFKKLIRRGNGAKSEAQDLREAIASIERYLRDVTPNPAGRD